MFPCVLRGDDDIPPSTITSYFSMDDTEEEELAHPSRLPLLTPTVEWKVGDMGGEGDS